MAAMRCSPPFMPGSPLTGKRCSSSPSNPPLQVMSEQSAETLRALLVDVVEQGTGYRAANRYCGSGGKTASRTNRPLCKR